MPVKAQASGVLEQPVGKVFQFHAVEHVQNHPRWLKRPIAWFM